MLETQGITAMRDLPNFRHLIFQHDGAPPHYALQVRQLLDRVFPNRWMGRDSSVRPPPIVWPARSPDLTPFDFWAWGDMKQRIFTQDFRPRTVNELKDATQYVVAEMNEDLRIRAFEEFRHRLYECVRRGGQSVERR